MLNPNSVVRSSENFRTTSLLYAPKKANTSGSAKIRTALCHRVAGRFDSAAFRAFGGGGRQFGRRLYPLPAGGGGRCQRQPSAFRLSSADRSAAIRHRRQRPGVLAELRQCGG